MQKLQFLESNVQPLVDPNVLSTIEDLWKKKYFPYLDQETISIECGKNVNQIQVRSILQKSDKTVYYPVELIFLMDSLPNKEEEDADITVFHTLLDYIDSYWNEYLTSERDVYLALDWDKQEYAGITFYVRGSVRNLYAEELAEKLLSEQGNGDKAISKISMDL